MRGELHAILQEVEPGLFSAFYPGEMNDDQAGLQAFPDAHISTSAEGVKTWVEQMAIGMGYQRVVWDAIA